jgi:hypothetical protein
MMMNREDILNMPSGREIDTLVAEKVMGWHIFDDNGYKSWRDKDGHYGAGINQSDNDFYEDEEDFNILHWHPSESIMWAWQVIEKMREDGFRVSILMPMTKSALNIHVLFKGDEEGDYRNSDMVFAETVPLAVCRAAAELAQLRADLAAKDGGKEKTQ